MSDKSKRKSTKRSSLARAFVDLGQSKKGLPGGLTYLRVLVGLGLSALFTVLITEYRLQSLPLYQPGEIADRTIEAPIDFNIVDEEATLQRKARVAASSPAVFDFDFNVNLGMESDLRGSLTVARQIVEQQRLQLGLSESQPFSEQVFLQLKQRLEAEVPELNHGKVLDILLKYSFPGELDDQMVRMLNAAMEHPGVVARRSRLLDQQDRGIVIRNTVTGEDSVDWMSVRDVEQAKDELRRNEFELTLGTADEKRELAGFLETWVRPNVTMNQSATDELLAQALSQVDEVMIHVKQGRTVVRAGDEVTESQHAQLIELRKLQQPGKLSWRLGSTFLIVAFFLFSLWQYFRVHYQGRKISQYLLLVLVMSLSLVIVKAFFLLADTVAASFALRVLQTPVHFRLYAPLALGAVLTMLLGGVHLTLLYGLIFSVFMGLLTQDPSLFIYTLTGSLAAIFALEQYRERAAIVKAGVLIGGVNILIALAFQLYSAEGNLSWSVLLVRTLGGLFSGLASAMLTSLFLPLLESIFGLTTDIRLLELSNLNSPILRRLALEAPGTYHHSLTVGTLAEAGAESISANSLLARVGAYYHDIGKLKHPDYYVENQIYSANKHEGLSPTMSSLILASHVKDGLAIAEEIGLAPQVMDLIPQHHGTKLMTYFYQKAKERADEKNAEINEGDFRYPGPKPQSQEAAILMLADQVEAAARTLQDPTPSHIRGLIGRLLQATIQDGQFDECNITMKELRQVAEAFERVLGGMYHHRIEYPGFSFNTQSEGSRPDSQRVQ